MRNSCRAPSPLLTSPTSKPSASRVVRSVRRNAASSSTIKTRPMLVSILNLLGGYGQGQEKRGARCCLAFNPHTARVRFCNSLHERQADSSSRCSMLRAGGTVKPPKNSELLMRIYVGSFILHAQGDLQSCA